MKAFLVQSGWCGGVLLAFLLLGSCSGKTANEAVNGLSPDESLFEQVTQTDPFTSYTLFPNADSVTSGTLNGSTAHQPLVRVSLNAVAAAALENGVLPVGRRFPGGSIVFKEIITGGQTTLFAIMQKDSANQYASNGWLWAELYPDGSVFYSVTNQGNGCVSCHSREQGPQNDHVRTFERQH